MTKRKEAKKASGKITITNGRLEFMMSSPRFSEAVKKIFPFKISYWIGRAVDRMDQLIRDFQKSVDQVIEQYAEKEKDKETGEEKPKRRPDGQVIWGKNGKLAADALSELREIEVDLGIDLIEIDLDKLDEYFKGLPAADKSRIPTPDDLALLMPFFKPI